MINELKNKSLEEMKALFSEMKQPAFRAGQVYSWLHKGAKSYEEMTNLPAALRSLLAEQYPLVPPVPVRKQESQKDGTV